MTLPVDLPPEMERFIKDKVMSGSYNSATDVIQDALHRMQAEERRVQALQAAIQKGDDELNRGEGIPYTPQLLEEITNAALDMGSGQVMDANVLPKMSSVPDQN